MTDVTAKVPRPPAHREYKSRKQREKEEAIITAQLSEFQKCVVQIRRISCNRVGKLEIQKKKMFINDHLCNYFIKEDREDVFEGFLRLFLEFGQSAKPNETFVMQLVFDVFYDYVMNIVTVDDQKFILMNTYSHDTDLFRDALSLAIGLKVRSVSQIALVFSLKRKEQDALVIDHIKKLLAKQEWIKAVLWMEHFNNRQHFDFEPILCELYMENRFSLLSTFIGQDVERRHRFIHYFDRLLGAHVTRGDPNAQRFYNAAAVANGHQQRWAGSTSALNELELRVIEDAKKLEKTIIKFVRAFNIGLRADQLAPNTLTLRCRDCLMYHYYRWHNKEISEEEHEEIALMAMASNTHVRFSYLNLLTKRGCARKALYFAVMMGLPNGEFPPNLLRFSGETPNIFSEVRAEVMKKRAFRELTNKTEALVACELNGAPIVVVNTWESMTPLLERLPKEPTVGIDAEWKPNFLSISEMVALIQVALPSVIYLIDVVTLESKLTEQQWLTFFEVLFCSPDCRKIGFDFANDLRVIASSFPFISTLAQRYTKVICIYRLLSQVVKYPVACKAVFGSEQFESNLSLSDISKHFLNYAMDKTEQMSNWLKRPLRMEQKKYAALDAYCLINIFSIVAERLTRLDDKAMLQMLQNAALITDKRADHEAEELEGVVGGELASDNEAQSPNTVASP